jgi:ADP-ribosylglycohydrolase
MRIAPVGLIARDDNAFGLGADIAALTHGHPTGYVTAGFLALTVRRLLAGDTLDSALDAASDEVRAHAGHAETLAAVSAARELARSGPPSAELVGRLGEGWVAEEALAIAVHAVLATTSFRDAVELAVNHGGDSDSTGAIAGNLAGVLYGERAIPAQWLSALELRDEIGELANDLHRCATGGDTWDPEREWARYPGW